MSVELELAETSAYHDSVRAASDEVGFEVFETAGAVCICARAMPDERVFNRVMNLGYEGPVTDDQLAAIAGFYGETPYIISAPPSAGIEADLLGRGYTHGYAWMRFAREAERLEPVGSLELRLDEADDFARIVRAAFGMPEAMAPWLAAHCGRPGWECWTAYADGEPAGAGALYVSDDVGWLGFGGTLPEQRGKGAQGALLAHRVRRAAERGCTQVTTETGVARDGAVGPSYRNILRAGFREAYERPNLVAPGR